ncbi:hypothetical protein GCM10010129_56570 [Streptomyces fumigatiscleroticus]|nr:hypothetical protein GCM10010129_56570 [Streptomyces fumigatiscleroticus]
MPRSYPPEFRRRVLDLIESGRKVAEVAQLLGISEQTVYVWRRQHLIDTGQMPGVPTHEQAELVTARKRIAELEAELAIHRRAAELLEETTSPKGGSKPSAQWPVRGIACNAPAGYCVWRSPVITPGATARPRHGWSGTPG